MPLRDIVTIALRLFSLMWSVQGLLGFVASAAAASEYQPAKINYLALAGPAILILLAILTWAFAASISKAVTPPPNPTIDVVGLTRLDLYCFAFVFLGVYFVLSSIGNAINQIHGYVILSEFPESDPMRRNSFYQLTQALITLVAGVVCITLSSRLSEKLANAQGKHQAT